jgi:hypothetical protein
MTVDPARRSTAAQALEHEFLSVVAPLRPGDRRPDVVIDREGVEEFFRQTQMDAPREAEEGAS